MPVISSQTFYIIMALEVFTAIPVGLSMKRLGFSPWWALVCFVPIVAIVALWVLAFIRWPRDAQPQP